MKRNIINAEWNVYIFDCLKVETNFRKWQRHKIRINGTQSFKFPMENEGYTKLFRFKSLNRTKSKEAIPELIFHFILPTARNLLKLRNLNRENGEWINLLKGKSGVLYDIPFILHFYCTSLFPLVFESSVHAIPSVIDCLSPSSVAFFALDRLGYTTWGKNG